MLTTDSYRSLIYDIKCSTPDIKYFIYKMTYLNKRVSNLIFYTNYIAFAIVPFWTSCRLSAVDGRAGEAAVDGRAGVGDTVEVHSMVRRPELNGLLAQVTGWTRHHRISPRKGQ